MTTDSTETPSQETPAEAQQAPEDDQGAEAPEGADTTTEPAAPAREAARYRRRLRDTEVERDGLAERLTGYQRAAAERLAAEHLSRGDDVWLGGSDVGAVLDDDGQVDAEKLAAVLASVLRDRPQLGVTFGRGVRPNPQQGRASTAKPEVGWQRVLKGR